MAEVDHRAGRLVLWAVAIGIMLVGLVATVANDFSEQKLVIAFISSGLLLVVGLVFRRRLHEVVRSNESDRKGEGHARRVFVIAIAYLIARQLSDVALTLVLGALLGITVAAAIAVESEWNRRRENTL